MLRRAVPSLVLVSRAAEASEAAATCPLMVVLGPTVVVTTEIVESAVLSSVPALVAAAACLAALAWTWVETARTPSPVGLWTRPCAGGVEMIQQARMCDKEMFG